MDRVRCQRDTKRTKSYVTRHQSSSQKNKSRGARSGLLQGKIERERKKTTWISRGIFHCETWPVVWAPPPIIFAASRQPSRPSWLQLPRQPRAVAWRIDPSNVDRYRKLYNFNFSLGVNSGILILTVQANPQLSPHDPSLSPTPVISAILSFFLSMDTCHRRSFHATDREKPGRVSDDQRGFYENQHANRFTVHLPSFFFLHLSILRYIFRLLTNAFLSPFWTG